MKIIHLVQQMWVEYNFSSLEKSRQDDWKCKGWLAQLIDSHFTTYWENYALFFVFIVL